MFVRSVINVVGIVVFASLVFYLAGHQLAQPAETAIIVSGMIWIYPRENAVPGATNRNEKVG